jgi:hypothetical protein
LLFQDYDCAVTLWGHTSQTKTPWDQLVTTIDSDGLEYRLVLPAHLLTVRMPRKLTEIALDAWGLGHLKDKAAVILSELVGNTLTVVPGSTIEVGVCWRDGWVRLEVWDESPEIPSVPATLSLDAEDGRGLWVSAHLADKFGIDPRTPGKTIWAMLLCESASD